MSQEQVRKLREGLLLHSGNGQWEDSFQAIRDGDIVELSEESYWHFLECLPPRLQTYAGYIVGSVYDYNSEGKGVYLCVEKIGDKYFGLHATVNEFKNEAPFMQVRKDYLANKG